MQNEIEKTEPITKEKTIQQLIVSDLFKQQIAKALPKHIESERFVRAILTASYKTPKLLKCNQASLMNVLLSLAQVGLEPDNRSAHLIPFENRKNGTTDCVLIIDYKGLVELAMRSGFVSKIHADVICEHDEFVYEGATGEVKHHGINFENRGKAKGAFAGCFYKDGSVRYEVMSKNDIEAIRARSKTPNSGPWVTDWNEMAKKTVFRRLSKWIPFSPEAKDIITKDDEQFAPIEGSTIKAELPNNSRVEAMKQKYVEKEVNLLSKDYIEETIKSAKTIDALNEAIDLSNSLENEEERKELAALFETRKKELLPC